MFEIKNTPGVIVVDLLTSIDGARNGACPHGPG